MRCCAKVLVLLSVLAVAGCAGKDARGALLDTLCAAGKVAYDSLADRPPPGRH